MVLDCVAACDVADLRARNPSVDHRGLVATAASLEKNAAVERRNASAMHGCSILFTIVCGIAARMFAVLHLVSMQCMLS